MAEFKKAIEKTLKPFARKVGSDIKGIESKVFAGKPINVVEFGIDNTGATDVTAKLNELFKKVHAEDYTEVIFPDGTYKINGTIDVTIPSDRQKYLYIHAQNRYKSKIEMHGTRETASNGSSLFTGFQLNPENFEVTTTRGYNLRFDGFVIEGHELPADETNSQPSQSIYPIISNQESHDEFNMYSYKLYNFTCTNMEFINTYYSIYLNCNMFDSELKNIHIEGVESPLDINVNESNNNSLDNITIKNCKGGINVTAKCSAKNIDFIYDDKSLFKYGNPTNTLTTYLASNISIKGFYDIGNPTEIITITSTGSCNVSDIRLDLKPIDGNLYINSLVPAFIRLEQNNSESGLLIISDVKFDKFEENFENIFEKAPKFAYFNSNIQVSIHGITETDHLKFFQDKAVNVVYEKIGSYNQSYNTTNTSFKPRSYLGTDRNMNGTSYAESASFGALYLASSDGTPLTGNNNEDYSENTAGVKGDIFTELNPEKYGHFAYVSTYTNVGQTIFARTDIESLTYNSDDKTYNLKFINIPVWKSGTLQGKTPNIGSYIKDSYCSATFEIIEADVDTKTYKIKEISEPKKDKIIPYQLGQDSGEGIFGTNSNCIQPCKINRMKNMTYVTVPIIHSGTTENRPTEHLVVGQMYFDTTVGAPVFWNGTQWIQGNNGGSIDTSAIPAANVTQDDNHYFVTKYQNKKLQDLYNKGEMDTKFATKTDVTNAIAAIPAGSGGSVDTSNLVTKEEFNTTLNAINEKLKELRGGNQ